MAVKAPPGFEPDDAEKRRVNAPPARSRFRKEDLYRSVLEFQSVDDHAIKVSQVEHDNFTDLIWHLVYSTGFRTELEKVRVIFRWMTSKNMHAITFRDGAKPGSPEDVLLSFQNKQGTYARTFEVLCRFAGLTSTILTGYAKGLDYRPGNQFKESNYNHSWNAVLIDGSWYLIDSHWATRYLVSEKNVAENLVYEYDDFFFLTDPEHLIYSHWSQAKEWQLLDRPVSLQDFESMPLVKSYFFKCAMHFVSHQQGVISTQKGRLALTLGYRKPTNFSYKITFADSGEEMYEGHKLKNYALQHHGHNHTDTIVFRAPRAGAYYFSFFAQLLTGEVGVKSTFTAACEYKVVADMASPAAMPLPLCSDATWGPGFAVEQLGLVANPPEGILTTTDGRVFLEFRKTKPAFVLCKLRRNGVEEEELERYIRDNDLGEAVQVTFQLPSTGEYGIEVYGNDPSKDGDTYTHICQYYVHYASPDEQQRAFYQESPERRAAMESFTFTVAAPDAYQPGSVGLESATASMALSDPDSLPPPPPELLDQQHYMPDTVPDTRQQQRYMPGQAPDTYQQQQQYVSGNVPDPHPQQYVSGRAPDARQQQQFVSASLPGTTFQQLAYTPGSAADLQQEFVTSATPGQRPQQEFVTSAIPGQRQQQDFVTSAIPGHRPQQEFMTSATPGQRQQPVVSEVRFTPAGVQRYPPGDQSASLQMNVSVPGVMDQSADRRDVYAPGSDQPSVVVAPSAVQVAFTGAPGQRDVSMPEASRGEGYAPGHKDSYAPVQVTYTAPNVNAPDTDQRTVVAPGVAPKTAVWTPGGQKEIYTPGSEKKNVWAPGSTPRDTDAPQVVEKKPPPTYKKPTWPPQKDSDAPAQHVWKPATSPRPADAPSAFQKVTYTPDVIRKPSWTPSMAQKDAETPGQKNVWKPGSAPQDANAPGAEHKVTYAPPVAKKPVWAPGSTTQRENDAPAPNVWRPGSAPKDGNAAGTEQKSSYAPVSVQRAVWAPGSGQREADAAPVVAPKNVWAPGSAQKNVWTPGGAQRDADLPSSERKDVYLPGSERKDVYTPGSERKDVYAPGSERKDVYAPGSERKDVYAPSTDRQDTYAPGTEPKTIYAPGHKKVWAPGSSPREADTPGAEQRGGYSPGSGQAPAAVHKDLIGLPQQAVVTSMVIPASTKPLQVQKRSVGQAPPTAPRDFQLVAVDQGQGEAPPPVPASTGPQQQKPSLQAIDQQVLQSVDDHAVQVSKSDHNNFRDLVWDLIFSKNITNEIEKVRVIFCWLASKNLKEMRFDQVEKGSPEEVLMGLKTGVTTYAMLFNTMCSYAGLHSKIIGGYAKGVDYVPGMKFGPGVNQHTWNAIYIYGTWCLIDAHWGARRLMGKQTSEEDFQYQLDEYFFLTDPHQLIYTHFPDDPRWQLLERCVTLEEFESMPHMKPQFFKLGLELVTHRAAVVRARGGVKVALRFPQRHHSLSVAFNFTLQFENGEETYRGVKLNRFGMHDIKDGVATFNLRLPVTAAYILFIYAKEEVGDRKEGVYSQVCEYKIEYETEPGSSTEPFPPCSSLTWGPCSAFHRYGLTTAQQSPVMVTQEGKARLEIRHPRPMQFMARLKHIDASDADLESYVMQRTVGDTTIFDVSPPGRGEYGLEIFANDPATEGQTLYHNAQYLIVCQEDVRTRPLPKLPPGYLGPQPRFSEFGMATVSHPDPVIHLDCNTVTVVFQTRQPMRILANLIAVEGEEDFSSFTFSNTSGLNLVLTVHLPKPGFFKLQVFGTPVSDSSQQIPGIYNYLVNCGQVTQPVFPFPKQFAQWKEGCFMAEPMAIVTTHGPFASQVEKERLPDTITFCVDIPGAKKVATVLDQEWTALEQGSDKRWSGKVKVGQHYGTSTRLTLNANYGADKTNYATLLEYFL